MHQPFASQRYNTHRVSFRCTTSFIHFSSVQSTRCPLFCSPSLPTSAAFTLRLLFAHVVPPFRKASLRFTCIVQPPSYPAGNILRRLPMELASPFILHGFTASPSLGARSRLRSFLSSASYGGSPPALQCGQVCRTNPCFFFCRRRFYRVTFDKESFPFCNLILHEKIFCDHH